VNRLLPETVTLVSLGDTVHIEQKAVGVFKWGGKLSLDVSLMSGADAIVPEGPSKKAGGNTLLRLETYGETLPAGDIWADDLKRISP
jgi:hypothetical protein